MRGPTELYEVMQTFKNRDTAIMVLKDALKTMEARSKDSCFLQPIRIRFTGVREIEVTREEVERTLALFAL